ncbi:hypothetical protein V2J09_007417 [Rumex salicifolius]
MGQRLSCVGGQERSNVLRAVKLGDLETMKNLFEEDSSLLIHTSLYDRQSFLHIAAASGQIHVLSWLLDRSVNPDVFNCYKQTPLMLAAMHGKISCVQKLILSGANILMFDSKKGRTCLHYAAHYGHSDCLQTILSTAKSLHIAVSWGFARFVNVRDSKGATPLHLAARRRQPICVQFLLDNGALVSASTGSYCYPGSTPLHLAARGGSLDCVHKLLAWGADRLQRDASGRIAHVVALKHKHVECAALLNPSSGEPLVWPSPLKVISELNPEAKLLLERALMEVNREREKQILEGRSTANSLASASHSESGSDAAINEIGESELCCICFDQKCRIEVGECGHQMCAHCILALCCHNKPNPMTAVLSAPVCPFCRSSIVRLAVVCSDVSISSAELSPSKLTRKSSRRFTDSLSGMGSSFSKIAGRGSGRRVHASDNDGDDEDDELIAKLGS